MIIASIELIAVINTYLLTVSVDTPTLLDLKISIMVFTIFSVIGINIIRLLESDI